MAKALTIASISAEVAPFSKAGGLGDVGRSLPKALHDQGHNVVVITPLYGRISTKKHNLELIEPKLSVRLAKDKTVYCQVWRGTLEDELPVYFIDYPRYFSKRKKIYGYEYDNRRFYLFAVAALRLLKTQKIIPDVIQCHDWHAGLVPWLVKKRFTS